MEGKHLFVTVGTTNFDNLISTLTDKIILDILSKLGYKSLQFQTGIGTYNKVYHESINIMYDCFFENFQEQIERSDLVISHAGAGTCLEVLKCRKPLIVVINNNLMDNHQMEIAEHLSNQEYLYYCTCDTLEETLLKDFNLLKPYPKVDVNTFGIYLNRIMKFPLHPEDQLR